MLKSGQTTNDVLGKIGLPAPISELATKQWDAIVVGGGHNGLACAFYLAQAGKKVLVLEAREQVGGACTIHETWPGYRISPCAYLAGLLHTQVIDDMQLVKRGFKWMPASGGFFIPFLDGSSIQLWEDTGRCEAEILRFAPDDLAGFRAMGDVIRRTADALRPKNDQDLWLHEPPSRDMIETRLGNDTEALDMLFDLSMAAFVERYLKDERLQIAYLGQGVIGTNASPFDKGTASIRYHHNSGRMDPNGGHGAWGFVQGGMGTVSFLMCDAALEAGVTITTETPVAQIIPGEGVILTGGDKIHAPVVISNADPMITLRLLGDNADAGWQSQVQSVPIEGCTVKVNMALHEPPNFTARPGVDEPHHRAQLNTPLTKAEWQQAYDTSRAGGLPEYLWTEDYIQTVFDPSIAPEGKHVMSVFAQYVPYTFAEGDWESRREEVGERVIASLARFTSNIPNVIIDMEIMGPPDIERVIGLTGGHIFQGECLPEYMWDKRLTYQTPMDGVYLCGASTYPGGSVIGVNGRNAALKVLKNMR